jgi:nitrogen fixation protein FixH
MRMPAPSFAQKTLTGRHVFLIFAGFFAVVFAVNAYFLRMALSTHSGVVANEPYRKGLRYNERILASADQAGRGWQDHVELSSGGRVLRVVLKDRSGRPVSGLSAVAILGRPSTQQLNEDLRLLESEPGRYEAPLGPHQPGTYIVDIEARSPSSPSDIVYRVRRRLWLAP